MAEGFPMFPTPNDPQPNWVTVSKGTTEVPIIPELNPEMTYAEGFNQSKEYTSDEYLETCPLGESVFKVELDNNGDDGEIISESYTYRLVKCKSGVDVYQYYLSEDKDYNPKSKELIIFYEYNPEGMDTFGTACMIKMGSERLEFMRKLNEKRKSIKVDNFERTSIKSWSNAIALHYNHMISDLGMDPEKIQTQILLEIYQANEIENLFSSFFSLNNQLANYINGLAQSLEDNKLGPDRYERDQEGFNPLIPIPEFEKTNESNLTLIIELIDKTINNPDSFIGKGIDLLLDTIKAAFGIDVRNILGSVSQTVSYLKDTIDQIKQLVQESFAFVNAFLCGLVNGLNSLVQFLLNILAFIIDNLPILENASEITQETRARVNRNIEVLEDVIELIVEKATDLFNTIKDSIRAIISGITLFIDFIGEQFEKSTRYFWAYFVGAVVFELIVDLVLAFLTGGTTIIGSIGKYIAKLKTLLKGSLKIVIRKGTHFSKNVVKSLRAEFDELSQALKNDELLNYLKGKLYPKGTFKNLKTKYPGNIKSGLKTVSKTFYKQLESIITKVDAGDYDNIFIRDHSKFGSTRSIENYISLRRRLMINVQKGKAAEHIFSRLMGGSKHKSSIKTSLTHRYIDNVFEGVGREIKSGFTKNTKSFQKQVMKDIEILKRKASSIDSIEWHLLGGIEEEAVDFIIHTAKEKGVVDLVKIVIY